MNALLLLAVLLPVIPQPRDPGTAVDLGEEGYRIVITNGRATVSAGTERGRLWARRTLRQLDVKGVPENAVIVDKPKYAVRGMDLDAARRYMPLSFLRRLVERMSQYKMNTLCLHLTDNEGFRLASETCPALTSRDGHYEKDEFRAFMKEARSLGVTVVPELDVPAHARHFARARPEFASAKYGDTMLDLDKADRVLPWLESVFAEYMTGADPVFVGPEVNVGMDEYAREEPEKFRAFMDAMFKMVRRYGYRPWAAGALTHAAGTTPVLADRDVTLIIWHNDFHQPLQAIEEGYSIVAMPDDVTYIVPKANCYYEYLNIKLLFEMWEPCCLEKVRLPWNHPQLRGGLFGEWNDCHWKISLEDLEKRLLHAIPTMAQKMWSGCVEGQSFEDFQELSARVEADVYF